MKDAVPTSSITSRTRKRRRAALPLFGKTKGKVLRAEVEVYPEVEDKSRSGLGLRLRAGREAREGQE